MTVNIANNALVLINDEQFVKNVEGLGGVKTHKPVYGSMGSI